MNTTKLFKNGPLPAELENAAYITPDGKEFALPRVQALAYLSWCEKSGFQILGYDVWIPSSDWPIVQSQYAFEGTLEDARAEILLTDNPALFFNVWVEKT